MIEQGEATRIGERLVPWGGVWRIRFASCNTSVGLTTCHVANLGIPKRKPRMPPLMNAAIATRPGPREPVTGVAVERLDHLGDRAPP